MSLSQPLGLHKHLTPPSRGLDIVPLFDVLLIALMLTLLGSRFIFAPGVGVDLPRASAMSGGQTESSASIAVLTLLKDNSLIYGGRLLSVENFEREANNGLLPIAGIVSGGQSASMPAQGTSAVAHGAAPTAAGSDDAEGDLPAVSARVLLVKSDAGVSLGTVLRVMNAARLAGYDRVQIAEQTSRAEERRGGAQLR